jgi:hypothetical protein
VLDAARHPDSDLHQYFEWDDTVAAEKYRRRQAVDLIGAVTIDVVDRSNGNESTPMRAFLNVVTAPTQPEAKPEKGYLHFDAVRGDKDLIAQVIAAYGDRLRQMADTYEKYKHFDQFVSVFSDVQPAIHAAIDKIPKKPAPFVGGA